MFIGIYSVFPCECVSVCVCMREGQGPGEGGSERGGENGP